MRPPATARDPSVRAYDITWFVYVKPERNCATRAAYVGTWFFAPHFPWKDLAAALSLSVAFVATTERNNKSGVYQLVDVWQNVSKQLSVNIVFRADRRKASSITVLVFVNLLASWHPTKANHNSDIVAGHLTVRVQCSIRHANNKRHVAWDSSHFALFGGFT